ncbi:MAG TPA: nitrous oxide reductase family maturation protein NosD [Cyclobacteriaceae bacterium]|nr:nitrous oxide reductase family maturation protein NosD [Cyclobacteriaceae bacterium]
MKRLPVFCSILTTLIILGRTENPYAEIIEGGPGINRSIREAIRIAAPGDTVRVGKGVYSEGNIQIQKKIHLVGIDMPVLDGNGRSEIFTITADSVTIEGFVFTNTGFSYIVDMAGIRIEQGKYCRIRNCRFNDTYFGIYLKSARHCTVEGNIIRGKPQNEVNSGNGIHMYDCDDILVKDNEVTGHRDGIYLEFTKNSTISGNNSYQNLRYGLHFMFSDHDEYIGNTFRRNGTGVAVMFSKNIIMKGNNFADNWGPAAYGLLFKEISDGELIDNKFHRNTVGILADGALRIRIRYNNFSENGWAMNIFGNSMNNEISNNNFIGNTFDLTTNSGRNNNLFLHNYWDQYTGYDLDRDGFGDVPHRPVKLFSYVLGKVSASIILLRSFFAGVIDFAEKVSPMITPVDLTDQSPGIQKNYYAGNQGS